MHALMMQSRTTINTANRIVQQRIIRRSLTSKNAFFVSNKSPALSTTNNKLVRIKSVDATPHFQSLTTSSSSSSTPYSSYDYPLAKEAPEITRTTAKEAALISSNNNNNNNTSQSTTPSTITSQRSKSYTSLASTTSLSSTSDSNSIDNESNSSLETNNYTTVEDPFDDDHTLSPEQVERERQLQREHLSTRLVGSTPITLVVPAHIPPNIPYTTTTTTNTTSTSSSSASLFIPETLLTKLDNGITVVSQDLLSQVSTVGVVSRIGSRHEVASKNETGVTNLLEILAFGATFDENFKDALQIAHLLQDWGGARFVNTGREQGLHCIDLLRPNVDKALNMLAQVLLRPQFSLDEVQNAQQVLQFAALDSPPELLLGEALHSAAYGPDQQLGQPHFSFNDNPSLTPEIVHAYWERQFINNPHGLVVAGAGIQHDKLVDLAQTHFGHLKQDDINVTPVIDSVYRGGQVVKQQSFDQNGVVNGDMVRVALAFPVGGWTSSDLVPACVLQTLLGGGSSFSAGGPGKGMYSRLYRHVLNRYHWVEAAEAVTSFAIETGLWGVSGAALPHKTRELTHVLAQNLATLAYERVSDEELCRARNMLKNNVLTQLESRLVLFEDLGRQTLTYGRREDMHTTVEKIEAVTAQDLQDLAHKALQNPPTVAAVGENCQNVPTYDEIKSWFQQ